MPLKKLCMSCRIRPATKVKRDARGRKKHLCDECGSGNSQSWLQNKGAGRAVVTKTVQPNTRKREE